MTILKTKNLVFLAAGLAGLSMLGHFNIARADGDSSATASSEAPMANTEAGNAQADTVTDSDAQQIDDETATESSDSIHETQAEAMPATAVEWDQRQEKVLLDAEPSNSEDDGPVQWDIEEGGKPLSVPSFQK